MIRLAFIICLCDGASTKMYIKHAFRTTMSTNPHETRSSEIKVNRINEKKNTHKLLHTFGTGFLMKKKKNTIVTIQNVLEYMRDFYTNYYWMIMKKELGFLSLGQGLLKFVSLYKYEAINLMIIIFNLNAGACILLCARAPSLGRKLDRLAS